MSKHNKLIEAIATISRDYWNDFQIPLLLSALPLNLQPHIANYRELLEGKTLKKFIQETLNENKYKLVEHPTLKAKVGIIPASESYEFLDIPKTSTKTLPQNTRETTLEFISILGKLSKEELQEINIPTYILIKLLK